MSWLDIAGSISGGSVVGYVIKHVRDIYLARLRSRRQEVATEERASSRDADRTDKWAIKALDVARSSDAEKREMHAQITELSIKVARCEERHRVAEERERETNLALQAARQLIDRQRIEIESLSAQIDDLREQFDRFVAKAMGVARLSEVPGE